jgi:hypothetical protein
MGNVKQMSYELGVAQTRVAQLEAPKPVMSRNDATDIVEIAVPPIDERRRGVVDAKSEASALPIPEKRRSWWRRKK